MLQVKVDSVIDRLWGNGNQWALDTTGFVFYYNIVWVNSLTTSISWLMVMMMMMKEFSLKAYWYHQFTQCFLTLAIPIPKKSNCLHFVSLKKIIIWLLNVFSLCHQVQSEKNFKNAWGVIGTSGGAFGYTFSLSPLSGDRCCCCCRLFNRCNTSGCSKRGIFCTATGIIRFSHENGNFFGCCSTVSGDESWLVNSGFSRIQGCPLD